VTSSEPAPESDLPNPQWTLTHTDWAALHHAYGLAADVPDMLTSLLDADQGVRTKAPKDLHGVVHHQNTLYEATRPAALYVAAILPDPRTARTIDKDRWSFPGCLRAELIGWIHSVAEAVSDQDDAIRTRLGFPLSNYPPAVAIREIRPQLYASTFGYAHDPDPHVREAAIAACIPLLDDPRLRPHRSTLVPLLQQVLGKSELWQYREHAIEALDAWGEDSSGLEGQRNPFEFIDSAVSPDVTSLLHRPNPAEGCSEDPPF
jgi:hypothetical protein